jgi:hypothetical protein
MKMKMLPALAILCIATAAHGARKNTEPAPWIQEPTSFLGINFKEKLIYQLRQCPEDYSIPNETCYQKPIYANYYQLLSLPNLGLINGYSGSVITHELKIREITLTTKIGDYESVKEMFIQRYGRPKSQAVEAVKTKGGGTFQNEKLYWEGDSISIILSKYGESIDKSLASVVNKSVAVEAIKLEQEKLKDSASKL